jgi:hypothetical protein
MKLRRQRREVGQGDDPDNAAAGTQWRVESAVIRDALVDDAMTAYVEWREECGAVWACYKRWGRTSAHEAMEAHSAYRAALDREEAAARAYSTRVAKLGTLLGQ